MAFSLTGLSRNSSGVGAGRNIWSYSSADAAAAVVALNYFDAMVNEFAIGDQVIIWDSNLGIMTISFVKSKVAGEVLLASGTAIGDV